MEAITKTAVIREVFNGKNYFLWEFSLRCFVMGQELLGFLDGSEEEPDEGKENEKALKAWKKNNAKVMSWIISTVEPHIGINLRSHTTAANMWHFLKKTYQQDNASRKYNLGLEIAEFTQGTKTVQEYYSEFMNIWIEYNNITYASVPAEALKAVQDLQEKNMRDQFLMRLRPEFETVRGNLMNRKPVPDLAECFQEILREEQRILSVETVDKAKVVNTTDLAFLSRDNEKPRIRDVQQLQCFSCQKYGHLARDCKEKFCRYCKKGGHILTECRKRPQNRGGKAYHTTVDTATASAPYVTTTGNNLITPESIQAMIQSALSAMGISGTQSSKTWYLDSGATNHMTSSSKIFSSLSPYCGQSGVCMADGNSLPIKGMGNIQSKTLHLSNVFHVPQLSTNLISVGQLVDNHCNVILSPSGCTIQDLRSGKVIGRGTRHGRLFTVDHILPAPSAFSASHEVVSDKWLLWHRRLGHPHSNKLLLMLKHGLLTHSSEIPRPFPPCFSCCQGKSKALPFPLSNHESKSSFELVHSDVWGFAPIVSSSGYKYFVTFIDDFSRFTWIYLLRAKSDVLSCFKAFVSMVNTKFGTHIKTLRSDSGGEYMSNKFQLFLQEKGITSQRSCPHTPQQNGLAERKNRHILEVTRTILLDAAVPPTFWDEAVRTAVFLINRQISAKLGNISPYFKLFDEQPNYNKLHPFGCICFVHLPSLERHKLSAQAVRCVFLGYAVNQKGFRCYDPEKKHIRVSRNVIFFDHHFFYSHHPLLSPKVSSVLIPLFDTISEVESSDKFKKGLIYERRRPLTEPTLPTNGLLPVSTVAGPAESLSLPAVPDSVSGPTPLPVRRSSRISRPPARYRSPSPSAQTSFLSTLSTIPIPKSYSQAVKQECWRTAMTAELDALAKTNTWDLVSCPPCIKPIGCKWVYTVKLKSDGSLERYKARLVALGNRQEYGIDYQDTFAPVAKMTTVRLLIALAASKSWPIFQMDVSNAFLNGDLVEEVFMKPPQGLHLSSPNLVCRLRKSLYGLKQAPRTWFTKLRSTIQQVGF